jgi:hypothetical protein
MDNQKKIDESVFFGELENVCQTLVETSLPDNFPSVFIPHIMPEYFNADKKIFYFGRDTYGWIPKREMLEYYSNNNLQGFINQTKSEFIHDYGFLEYNNNSSSGFWTLAMRLHLKLKGVDETLPISNNFPLDKYNLINDFGYGNTNSIELESTLKKWGGDESKSISSIWNNIDSEDYHKIKKASKKLDKLKHTIDAYHPDLVFIFNWDCNEKEFLEGLEYIEEKHDFIDGHFWTYFIPKYNTHVIWTVHPNNLKFKSMNANDLIEIILNYVNKI